MARVARVVAMARKMVMASNDSNNDDDRNNNGIKTMATMTMLTTAM